MSVIDDYKRNCKNNSFIGRLSKALPQQDPIQKTLNDPSDKYHSSVCCIFKSADNADKVKENPQLNAGLIECNKRREKLRCIWEQAKLVMPGDPVDCYHKARGLNLSAVIPVLRFHPNLAVCARYSPTYPAHPPPPHFTN